MPLKIEALIKSQRVADRWYVRLEGGESIRVDTGLIAQYSLYSGRELTGEELESLRESAAASGCRARALRMLGARMLSEKELYDKLIEKGETPENACGAVKRMAELGYIDDGEYAAAIVRRYSGQGYGLGRVRQELYRRGVPKELWETALQQLPEDTSAIDGLLRRRLGGREEDPRERRRAVDMLRRRGFSWEEIKSALQRMGAPDCEDY